MDKLLQNTLLISLLLVASYCGYSQISTNSKVNNDRVSINTPRDNSIRGLKVYPNPVNNGKVYILTSKNLVKEIEILDMLGNKVLSATLNQRKLDVSRLSPGIYILKIKEAQITAIRRLVIE